MSNLQNTFPSYVDTVNADSGYPNYDREQKTEFLRGYMENFAQWRNAQGMPFTAEETKHINNFFRIEQANINFGLSETQLDSLVEASQSGINIADKVIDEFGPADELLNFSRAFRTSFKQMGADFSDSISRMFGNPTSVQQAETERLARQLMLPTREGTSEFVGTVGGSLVPTIASMGVAYMSGGATAPTAISSISALAYMGTSSGEAGIKKGEVAAILSGREYSGSEKFYTWAGYATSEVAFEYLRLKSLNRIMGRLGSMAGKNSDEVAEALKQANKNARRMTDDVAERVGRAAIEGKKQLAIELGKIYAGQGAMEAVQEVGTELGQIATDLLFTPIDRISTEEFKDRVANAAAGGAVGGLMLGAPVTATAAFVGTSRDFRAGLQLKDILNEIKMRRDRGEIIDNAGNEYAPGAGVPFLGEFKYGEKGSPEEAQLDTYRDLLIKQLPEKGKRSPEQQAFADNLATLRSVKGDPGSLLDQLEQLVAPLGINVLFVDESAGTTSTQTIDGQAIDDRNILVNIRSESPLDFVIGHEAFHTLKNREGVESNLAFEIEDLINQSGPYFKEYQQRLAEVRAKVGLDPLELNKELEEVAADFFGSAFLQEEFWNGVAKYTQSKKDTGLMGRLIEAALGVARRFLHAVGASNIDPLVRGSFFNNYENAMNLAIDLYTSAAEQFQSREMISEQVAIEEVEEALMNELNGSMDLLGKRTFRDQTPVKENDPFNPTLIDEAKMSSGEFIGQPGIQKQIEDRIEQAGLTRTFLEPTGDPRSTPMPESKYVPPVELEPSPQLAEADARLYELRRTRQTTKAEMAKVGEMSLFDDMYQIEALFNSGYMSKEDALTLLDQFENELLTTNATYARLAKPRQLVVRQEVQTLRNKLQGREPKLSLAGQRPGTALHLAPGQRSNQGPVYESLKDWQDKVLADKARHPGFRWLESVLSSRSQQADMWGVSLMDRLRTAWGDVLGLTDTTMDYAKQFIDDNPLPGNDPQLTMRLFASINAKIEEMFDNGVLIFGEHEGRATGGGLNWLIAPLAEDDAGITQSEINQRLKDVASLMISERIIEKSIKHNLDKVANTTPQDAQRNIDELKADPAYYGKLVEAAKRYRQWATGVLRYSVASGRMSQEQFNWVTENNMQYVAMLRLMQTEVIKRPDGTTVMQDIIVAKVNPGGQLGSEVEPLKKFVGKSKKQITNVYESLLLNTHRIIKEADRNHVIRSFVDVITQAKSKEGLTEGQEESLERIGKKIEPGTGAGNTIRIFRDGKAEEWQFDVDLYKSIRGLYDIAPLPWVVRFLPSVFRSSITYAPPFIVRNVIRDTQHRLTVSYTGTRENLKSTFAKYGRMDIDMLRRYGGDQAGYYHHDRIHYARALDSAIKHHGEDDSSIIVAPWKLTKFAGRGYKKAVEGSERINRIKEFQAAYAEVLPHVRQMIEREGITTDPSEIQARAEYHAHIVAAARARGLMDFAVSGSYVRIINQVVPFTNAHIQGLRRSIAMLKKGTFGPFVARWLAFAVLPTILVRALAHSNGSDDEYEVMPNYLKDLFWNIKVSPDLWLRIPKNYEIGVLTSFVERGISKYAYGAEHAYEGYLGSVMKTLTPIDEASMLGPFVAFGEAAFNYDSFRNKQVVPWYEINKDLDLRAGTKNASKIGQYGQEFMQMVGLDEYKITKRFSDARIIDHVIKGQFGTLGSIALSLPEADRKKKTAPRLQALSGVFTGSPAYASRDVLWVYKEAASRGIPRNHRMLTKLRFALEDLFDHANTPEERDTKAAKVREVAKDTRNRFTRMKERQIGPWRPGPRP